MSNILSRFCCFKLKETQQEKDKLEAIYNSLPDAIYTTDFNRKITSFNAGGERVTGFKKDDVIGKPCKDVFAHEDEKGNLLCAFGCPLDNSMKTGKAMGPIRGYTRTASGKRIPILIASAPIKDKSGRITGAAEFFRDITKEVKIEQLKSDFISVVSHELRTPLAAIKETIALVLDGIAGPTTDSQQSVLTTAKNEIDRMNRLIGEILDVSRIEIGRLKLKRSKLDLKEIVETIEYSYRPISEKKSIRLLLDVAPGLPEVIGDADRVRQVFSNLLSNAFKFTSQGGSITIKCKPHSPNLVECSVIDTGCGMPAEALHKLFGRFEQLDLEEDKRRGGAGLGLYISKTIVDALGGSMWAQSVEGKGSTFSFTLPIYREGMDFYLEFNAAIKEARDRQASIALLMFQTNLKEPEFENLALMIENIVRGPNDSVLKEGQNIFVALADTDKTGAQSVKQRVKMQLSKSEFGQRTVVERVGLAIYPQEAITLEELLDKVKKQAIEF